MGMMTEHPSLDDLVANAAQAPALARMADLMAGQIQHQTEIVRRLVLQPKSESRLAWEAAHPSWVDVVSAGLDCVDRLRREILLGEPGVATPEMLRAGCRR